MRETTPQNNIITKEQGEEMCKTVGALKYMECSAKTREGVKAVFEESIRVALKKSAAPPKKATCLLL